MYFTTTRLHQELAGGTFVDVIIPEAHDPASEHPFKGNVDLGKLEELIERVGARAGPLRLPRGHGEHGRRAADLHGQPPRGPRLSQPATASASFSTPPARVENAYFIQQREPGYADEAGGRDPRASSARTPTAAR